jgi:hypothetical protein
MAITANVTNRQSISDIFADSLISDISILNFAHDVDHTSPPNYRNCVTLKTAEIVLSVRSTNLLPIQYDTRKINKDYYCLLGN